MKVEKKKYNKKVNKTNIWYIFYILLHRVNNLETFFTNIIKSKSNVRKNKILNDILTSSSLSPSFRL